MRQKLLCGCFLFFLFVTGAFAAPLMTDSITGPTPLLRHMAWLPDSEGRFDIAAVRAEGMQASFLSLERGFPLNATGAGWLRLDLAKQQPGKDGSMSQNPEHPLILNLGGLPPGISTLFTTGRNGLPAAQDTWYAEKLRPHAQITLPDPGLAGSAIFIHMQETPGLWFTPMLNRGPGDSLLVPPDLLLPGLLLACMAACLLRAVSERRLWPLWAALMLACVLAEELLPLPVNGIRPTYADLPAFLAPGLCLIIYPHLGRLLLHTPARSPLGDTLLKLLSLPGVCVCLAPLLPGYGWLTRLFPLWGIMLAPLLPFAIGALAARQQGAFAFLAATFMPAVGAAISLYFIGQPAMHPVVQNGALWGAAIGGIALALARVPRDRPKEQEEDEEDFAALPAFGQEPDGQALLLDSPVSFPGVAPMPLAAAEEAHADIPPLGAGSTPSLWTGLPVKGGEKDPSSRQKDSLESFLQTPPPPLAPISVAPLPAPAGLTAEATPLPEKTPAMDAERPARAASGEDSGPSPFDDFDSPSLFGFSEPAPAPLPQPPAQETAKQASSDEALFTPEHSAAMKAAPDGITVDTGNELFAAMPLDAFAGKIAQETEAAAAYEADNRPSDAPSETPPASGNADEAPEKGIEPPENTAEKFFDESFPVEDLPLHPFAELVREKAARGENVGNVIDFDPLDEMEIAGFQRSSQPTGETYIFNLLSVIREIHDAVAPLAEKKGILLSWHSSPSLPFLLLGDVARLRQTLTLLLQNAIIATSSGAVQLFAREEAEGGRSGRIQFSVSDTGAAKRSNAGFFHAWELADTTGGSFSIEYVPGGGTQVNFTAIFKIPSRTATETFLPDPGAPRPEAVGAASAQELFPLSQKLLADLPLASAADGAPALAVLSAAGNQEGYPPPARQEAAVAAHVDNAISAMLSMEPRENDADSITPNVIISDMTTSNRRLLSHYLSDCNACCVNAQSLAEAASLYEKSGANLIIYDADSPEQDIIRCMGEVHQYGGTVAQLVLTSHAGQEGRMLAAGATCTIEKPFAKEAFLALVKEHAPAIFSLPPAPSGTVASGGDEPSEPAKARVRVTPVSRTVAGPKGPTGESAAPAPASAPVSGPPSAETTPPPAMPPEEGPPADMIKDEPPARLLPEWADRSFPADMPAPLLPVIEPTPEDSLPALAEQTETAEIAAPSEQAAPFEPVVPVAPFEPVEAVASFEPFEQPAPFEPFESVAPFEALEGSEAAVQGEPAGQAEAREPAETTETAEAAREAAGEGALTPETPEKPAPPVPAEKEASISAAPLLHSLSMEDVLGESRSVKPSPPVRPKTSLMDLFITDEPEEAMAATPAQEAPGEDRTEGEGDTERAATPVQEAPRVATVSIVQTRPTASARVKVAPSGATLRQRPLITVQPSAAVDETVAPEEPAQASPHQEQPAAAPAEERTPSQKPVKETLLASAPGFGSAIIQSGELREPQKPLLKKLQAEAMLPLPGIEDEYLETLMLPLVPGLLHTLKDTLKDAIRGKNEHQALFVQEAVSRLSGKAEIFGLERLAKIANCVERAAEADDFEAVDTLLVDLINVTGRYITSLQECYDQYKSRL